MTRCLTRSLHVARSQRRTGGFTLVELLVTISIISILASLTLFAMSGAQETARRDRTRAQIARIDALLAEKWESYTTRRIATYVRDPRTGQEIQPGMPRPTGTRDPYRMAATVARVDGIRELMRMELPARKADVLMKPVVLRERPFLTQAYRAKAEKLLAKRKGAPLNGPAEVWLRWSTTHQGAECLYLILSQLTDDESSALRFFSDAEIGDVDGDGMPEILDAWGSPIEFLRWAPGFYTTGGGYQDQEAPEAFDPAGVYAAQGTFAIYPLVFSPGPDKLYEINVLPKMNYINLTPPNNPYFGMGKYRGNGAERPAGAWVDTNKNGRDDSRDNIHNHLMIAGS